MAADLAEELRRSQIADALSLLGLNEPPSTDDTDASSKSDQPDVPKHVADHFGNPNDWPTVYDTTTQQAVGAPSPEPDIQHKLEPLTSESVGISPPEAPASAAPAPAPIESEYVGIEPDRPTLFGGQYSKDAFQAPEKRYPTVAEDQGAELPADTLPQAERATLVKLPDEGRGERGAPIAPDLSQTTGFAVADPNPVNHDYRTPLSSDQEKQFQAWVKKNNVPFDDSGTSDYDMRGFWKAGQEGDPDASTAVSKFDGKIHFNDKFKTPFHKTFSNESQYATPDAPHWVDDKLIDNQGNVVADETPGTKGKQLPVHVEKALPAATPAPLTADQVERALPTGPKAPGAHTELAAPGQMDLREDTDRPTAKAVPAQSAAPAAQPTQVAAKVNPNDPNTWPNADGSPVLAPVAAPASKGEIQPDISGQNNTGVADYFRKRGDAPITSENDPRLTQINVGGSQFNVHQEAAPYFQGFLKELADQGAPMRSDGGWNYRQKVGAKGLSEHSWAGAIDLNQDGRGIVTPAFQKWIAQHPGALQAAEQRWHIYGGERFGDLGHFEWGGVKGDSGAASIDNQPNLNVTHYAYKGDPDLDSESRAGHGKYVKDMVAGYDVALNDAAAAALGAKPGQEFEYGGRTWRYADQVPELYKDARIDIYDPNNHFGDFKPAGGVASAPAVKKSVVDDWPDVAPAAVATAQSQTGKEFDTLNAIRDRTPNVGALWRTLNSPIAGVSDNARTQYLTQAKKGITDYALDYYKESHPGITPDEAFKLATGDADFGTLAGEVSTKIIPNLQSAAISLNRAPQTVDENRINDFLNVVNPNLTPEQRIGFKRDTMSTLAAMNPTERAQYIGNLVATDPQKFAGFDVAALADSFDRISDPAYQARFKSDMDLAVAKNKHDLATDPRLVNTSAEGLTQFLASVPKNLAETFGGPIGQSAMLSEIYFNTADQLRHEHPDWSEDDVKQKASASTLAQLGPQELLMRVTGGLLGAATKGITNPLMEFGARYGLHGTVAAVAGGVQQMGKNLAEGRPMMDGVPEAAGSAAPYGLVGAAVGGRHYPEPGPEPTVMEPNLNTFKVHGPPEPAADTGFVHGPSGEFMAAPEDTGAVHGPILEETGLSHGPTEPRDTRRIFGPPAPRTTFTPAELAEQIGAMRGKTPEELAAEAQTISPPVDMTARDVGNRGPSTQVQEARAQAQVEQQTLGQRVARLSIVQRSVFNDLRRDGMTPEEALPRVERSTKTSYPDVRADALAPLVKAQPKAVLADQIKRSRIAQGLGVKEMPAAAGAVPSSAPLGGAQIKVRNTATGKSDAVLVARDETAFSGKKDLNKTQAVPPYQVHGPFPIEGHTVHVAGDIHGFKTDAEVYQAIKTAAAKHGWTIESDPRYKYAEPWINKFEGKPGEAGFPTPAHASVYNDLVSSGMDETRARDFVSKAKGNTPAEILADVQTQMRGPTRPGSVDDPATRVLRAKQPHIYAKDSSGRENVAMVMADTNGTFKVMMPRQGMSDPNAVYKTAGEAQDAARSAFEKSGWKVSFDPREAGEPAIATPIEKNPGHPEPWLSEIANRFMAERIRKGEIGPVEPGHGETTEALVARGSRMNPEQIAQHVSNLKNNVGGDPTDQAAAVRFEEARLAQRSYKLSQIAEADPTNQQAKADADEAFRFVTDFHTNVVVKLKNDWHKRGMTLQGSMPVDLTTFNGQREAYLRNTDKAPMPDTEKVLKQNVQKVKAANAAELAALQKYGAESERQSARRNLPSHEQNKDTIARRMRGEFPCPT